MTMRSKTYFLREVKIEGVHHRCDRLLISSSTHSQAAAPVMFIRSAGWKNKSVCLAIVGLVFAAELPCNRDSSKQNRGHRAAATDSGECVPTVRHSRDHLHRSCSNADAALFVGRYSVLFAQIQQDLIIVPGSTMLSIHRVFEAYIDKPMLQAQSRGTRARRADAQHHSPGESSRHLSLARTCW